MDKLHKKKYKKICVAFMFVLFSFPCIDLATNRYFKIINVTNRHSMFSIVKGLEQYHCDYGSYPLPKLGLEVLLQKREKNPDKQPYVFYREGKKIIKTEKLKDPWGGKYLYLLLTPEKYEIISYGKDKKEGGEKSNMDWIYRSSDKCIYVGKKKIYPPKYLKVK